MKFKKILLLILIVCCGLTFAFSTAQAKLVYADNDGNGIEQPEAPDIGENDGNDVVSNDGIATNGKNIGLIVTISVVAVGVVGAGCWIFIRRYRRYWFQSLIGYSQ